MKNILKNKYLNLNIVVMLSIMMLAACSNNEAASNSTGEQADSNGVQSQTTNDSPENSKNDADSVDDVPVSDFSTKEDEVPPSTFSVSEMSIDSFIVVDEMGIDSDIDKEVMETLNEFNAVNTDDGTKLTLPDDILFDFDSDELRSGAEKTIDKLVKAIEAADDKVKIVGHTDNKGKDDYNQELSENRAKAVEQALIDSGIKEDRLESEGKGASEPVAENKNSDGSDNPDGRQKNRRVEVTIQGLE